MAKSIEEVYRRRRPKGKVIKNKKRESVNSSKIDRFFKICPVHTGCIEFTVYFGLLCESTRPFRWLAIGSGQIDGSVRFE